MKNVKTNIMIESCSSKYMLLIIVFLGGIMYLTLIYESQWTSASYRPGLELLDKNTSEPIEFCWRNEKYSIVQPCQLCTDFEIRSKSVPACDQTHYKEAVKCLVSKHEVYRSCGNQMRLKEKQFWKFEIWMLVASLVSSVFVFVRQKILDRCMTRKIQRQLACNV